MGDILKIIESHEEFGLLIKVIENEAKKDFLTCG